MECTESLEKIKRLTRQLRETTTVLHRTQAMLKEAERKFCEIRTILNEDL